KGSNYYIQVAPDMYAGLRNYDTTYKTAYGGFFMERIRNEQVVYNLRADNFRWDTAKNKWKLENAVERKIDGSDERLTVSPRTHLDLKVLPGELRPDKCLKDKRTPPPLKHFIRREESRGSEGLNDYKVERFRRDATPFSVVLPSLMG